MAHKELSLEELKEIIDNIREDVAKKKGERQAEMNVLKKEFGLANLDDAYKELSKLEKIIQDQQREKAEQLSVITKKLQEFGYA